MNHTIFAFKSGFLTSLTSRETLVPTFLVSKSTICSLFSPVLPKINEDLAV
jgi:hypothetical protein